MGANLEAKLIASKRKKGKGQGKVGLSTTVIDADAPPTTTINSRGDLSHLPPPITVLRATLQNMPLATNVGVPLPLKEFFRHLAIEMPVLVDEEEVREDEKEGTRVLKRKRRQEAPHAPIGVSSEEEEEDTELLDPSSIEGTRDVGESSSLVKASLLDATELLGVSISSKSCSNNSRAFANFSKLVLTKLDLFEICSTRKDWSFIYDFRYMVKVRVSIFYLPFLFFSLFFFSV